MQIQRITCDSLASELLFPVQLLRAALLLLLRRGVAVVRHEGDRHLRLVLREAHGAELHDAAAALRRRLLVENPNHGARRARQLAVLGRDILNSTNLVSQGCVFTDKNLNASSTT